MPKKKSSATIRRVRLRNLKRAIAANSHMSSRQKSKARATVNRQLGNTWRLSPRPSSKASGHRTRARSDRMMRDGLQEIGEVIFGWLSEPVQKAMDVFHIARGSAKIVKAIEHES